MVQIRLYSYEWLNIYFLSRKKSKRKENKTLKFLTISNIEGFTVVMMFQIFWTPKFERKASALLHFEIYYYFSISGFF